MRAVIDLKPAIVEEVGERCPLLGAVRPAVPRVLRL